MNSEETVGLKLVRSLRQWLCMSLQLLLNDEVIRQSSMSILLAKFIYICVWLLYVAIYISVLSLLEFSLL